MGITQTAFRVLLGRRLPITSGDLTVAGIESPVVVRRDRYGIPYIQAESDEDAWYGLGFCQAQDRAFTLETMLRVARGTLSEVVGARGLAVDRLSRRIGLLHSAQPHLDVLEPNVRAILDSFARGITQGIEVGAAKPAHEFALLRTKPTPWTALDVMAVSKLQAFAMASNWDVKLARYRILLDEGPEALQVLEPDYPEWHPVSVPQGTTAGPAADRLAQDLHLFGDEVGMGGASNSWAVSASRTASGRPILADDPHLPPSMPPHWYLAHVRTPDWAVAGASFVGAPVFPAGHNEVAAWGVTLGLADNTDLYVEELSPDGDSVRNDQGFTKCETRNEVIRVKGGKDVVETVKVTPRGPIVGPALAGEFGAVSMQAKWLEASPMRGFLTAFKARSFEEFRGAFEQWPSISFNIVYADTSDAIGWLLVGDVPRRRKGSGTVPMPGWDPDAGWEDEPVPFSEMPFLSGPPSGYVASANNSPIPSRDEPYLGSNWIEGYRLARIEEVLKARTDWDVAAMMELQMDQVSLPWREMRDTVLSIPVEDEHAVRALEVLREWDGVVAADSAGAAVFELFVEEMTRRLAQAKAPRSWRWAVGVGFSQIQPFTLVTARRVGFLVRMLREQPDDWFDRLWADEIEDALQAVYSLMLLSQGPDHDRWTWGGVRPLTLRHQAGTAPVLGKIFNRGPFRVGADTNTVAQTASNPLEVHDDPLVVASLRMVLDVGNWEESRFVLPGGQSGNPLSPHYDDQLPLWLRGDGVPMAWSPDAVQRAAVETLRLEPSGPLA